MFVTDTEASAATSYYMYLGKQLRIMVTTELTDQQIIWYKDITFQRSWCT